LEWLTLHFGFHVEHHLFPWMSARHGRVVRALIVARWPERYQSMTIGRALLSLHRTGRVYKNARTLADMRGGKEWATLWPRERDAQRGAVTACVGTPMPVSEGVPRSIIQPLLS
jgi:fatty acid desaturase